MTTCSSCIGGTTHGIPLRDRVASGTSRETETRVRVLACHRRASPPDRHSRWSCDLARRPPRVAASFSIETTLCTAEDSQVCNSPMFPAQDQGARCLRILSQVYYFSICLCRLCFATSCAPVGTSVDCWKTDATSCYSMKRELVLVCFEMEVIQFGHTIGGEAC